MNNASDMAFGLMVMTICCIPLSFFFALPPGFLLLLLFPDIGLNWTIPALTAVIWLACMQSVVRRYVRISRTWTSERRGSTLIRIVELLALAGMLLGALFPSDVYLHDLKRFYAALVLTLTISHAVTYALLRYKPTPHELLIWGITGAVAGFQLLA